MLRTRSQTLFGVHLDCPIDPSEIASHGKYVDLTESYKSLHESLVHGGIANDTKVELRYVSADELEESGSAKALEGCHGILVPGGFGSRGIEGKVYAARFARENKVPFFGICLGLQALFEKSEEAPNIPGLAFIPGEVRRFNTDLAVPHIGWNGIKVTQSSRIFNTMHGDEKFYFVHSYYPAPE